MSGSSSLICQEITTEEGFACLRERWEALFARCAYPTPFCTWDWAWRWWRQLGAPDPLDYRLLILTVTDAEGTLIGIAPFYYPARPGSSLRLIPLRLLGTRIRCRMEDMTDEPILLLREGREQAALQAVLSHLTHARPSPWDITHVQIMRPRAAPGLAALWNQGPRDVIRFGSHLRSVEGQIVALPDTWETFLRSLSRSMRDNLPYYPRLLTRHGHDWSIRTAQTPAEVSAASEVLTRLHHCRSQSERGVKHQDHLPGAAYERFLHEALTALAVEGRARIVLLEVAGVPIAAQAVLEQDPMVLFYYSGFDPAWHSYSPITILNAHVIADAITRGLPFVNYLPETEPWKTRWGATGHYVLEELTWMPLRPRPILRGLRRGLIRAWQRRFGDGCECGFCALPLTRAMSIAVFPAAEAAVSLRFRPPAPIQRSQSRKGKTGALGPFPVPPELGARGPKTQ